MAWILTLKVFLITTAVLFTALGLKASVPLATTFFATHLPLIWNFFLLCFKPPYLYVIVNAIIISIAASSRFHLSTAVNEPTEPTPSPNAPAAPAYEMKSPAVNDLAVVYEPRGEEEPPALEVKAVGVNCSAAEEEEEEEEEKVILIDDGMKSMWTPPKRMDSTETAPVHLSPTEKPLVSARFGHGKPLKSRPEVVGVRASRVAKPKRHETLENTWKMITEGQAMPLSRHMNKCNTWQNRGSEVPTEGSPVSVKKSETFKDRTKQSPAAPVPAGTGKLRKEPSLSQDELNRRVEAFIQKFNQQMRLQRQESLKQYMETINRGSH